MLDIELDKRQNQTLQRLHDPPEHSAKDSRWKIQKFDA